MVHRTIEQQMAHKEEKKRQLKATRAASKRKWEKDARRLMTQIRRIVPECGLTLGQLSKFSGVVKSGITRILRGRTHSAQFATIVRLLGAAGYRLEIVPIDPHKDEYREYRRCKLPPLEDR